MNTKAQEQLAADGVKAIKDYVARALAPVVANVGGIAGRLDRHFASIEALERRLAALERKQGGEKARPVSLLKADDR